jgi:hypothetical protein
MLLVNGWMASSGFAATSTLRRLHRYLYINYPTITKGGLNIGYAFWAWRVCIFYEHLAVVNGWHF